MPSETLKRDPPPPKKKEKKVEKENARLKMPQSSLGEIRFERSISKANT